jgi:hypothetical protein
VIFRRQITTYKINLPWPLSGLAARDSDCLHLALVAASNSGCLSCGESAPSSPRLEEEIPPRDERSKSRQRHAELSLKDKNDRDRRIAAALVGDVWIAWTGDKALLGNESPGATFCAGYHRKFLADHRKKTVISTGASPPFIQPLHIPTNPSHVPGNGLRLGLLPSGPAYSNW